MNAKEFLKVENNWEEKDTGLFDRNSLADLLEKYAQQSNRLDGVVIRKITDIAEQALKEWKTKIYSDDGAEKDAIYEKMVDIQVNNFTVYLLEQIESSFSV